MTLVWSSYEDQTRSCVVCGRPTRTILLSRLVGQTPVCKLCWPRVEAIEQVPRCGQFPRFSVGDVVRVVRVYPPTSTDLLGFEGVIGAIDSLDGPQHNYDVSGRYLNEQMLELVPHLRRPRPAHRRLE